MKIVRYFIQEESQDSGINGFTPMWIPKSANFDPMDARGMVHDMLEHRLCDTGKFHEELMAFGRLIALRALPGFGFENRYYSPEDNLGSELSSLYCRAMDSEQFEILKAPETGFLDNRPENFIQAVAAKFSKSVRSESESYSDKIAIPSPEQSLSLISWLRIGYLDALRRYGQLDHGCYDTGHCMTEWAKRYAKGLMNLAEEQMGHVVRVVFDHKAMKMHYDTFEENPDTGRHATWLHNRVRAWKRS